MNRERRDDMYALVGVLVELRDGVEHFLEEAVGDRTHLLHVLCGAAVQRIVRLHCAVCQSPRLQNKNKYKKRRPMPLPVSLSVCECVCVCFYDRVSDGDGPPRRTIGDSVRQLRLRERCEH